MQIKHLIESKSELTHAAERPGPIVLSTRVRLARNLLEFPFPGRAKAAGRNSVYEKCSQSLAALPQLEASAVLAMRELSDLEKQVLVERHLISRELSGQGEGSGVVISPDQSCAVMINEEDHLRIQVMRGGYHFKDVWRKVNAIDSGLEHALDFAFSPELGYLTACPTNLGTGLRASVMMHLPGLVLANQMEKVVRAVNQLGMVVRGLFGEGSDASGSVFQISNQQTLGESEADIIKRIVSVLDAIVEQEENARQKLLESNPDRIFDKIGRAYGTLSHGHVISSSESMNLLSLIRLAVDLGILKDSCRSLVDRLFIESQPGHIQMQMRGPVETGRRDVQRAAFLREQIGLLSPLSFDNCGKN